MTSQQRPEQIVSKVLEPGEKILWSGKPNIEAAMGFYARSRNWSLIVGIGLLLIFGWLLTPGAFDIADMQVHLPSNQNLLMLVAFLLFPAARILFKGGSKSRLKRYVEGQTYAITNQRLLVLQKGKAEEETLRQVVITMIWPGGSPDLRQVVESIVNSIEIR